MKKILFFAVLIGIAINASAIGYKTFVADYKKYQVVQNAEIISTTEFTQALVYEVYIDTIIELNNRSHWFTFPQGFTHQEAYVFVGHFIEKHEDENYDLAFDAVYEAFAPYQNPLDEDSK